MRTGCSVRTLSLRPSAGPLRISGVNKSPAARWPQMTGLLPLMGSRVCVSSLQLFYMGVCMHGLNMNDQGSCEGRNQNEAVANGGHGIPLEQTRCAKALHKGQHWVTSGIWGSRLEASDDSWSQQRFLPVSLPLAHVELLKLPGTAWPRGSQSKGFRWLLHFFAHPKHTDKTRAFSLPHKGAGYLRCPFR